VATQLGKVVWELTGEGNRGKLLVEHALLTGGRLTAKQLRQVLQCLGVQPGSRRKDVLLALLVEKMFPNRTAADRETLVHDCMHQKTQDDVDEAANPLTITSSITHYRYDHIACISDAAYDHNRMQSRVLARQWRWRCKRPGMPWTPRCRTASRTLLLPRKGLRSRGGWQAGGTQLGRALVKYRYTDNSDE